MAFIDSGPIEATDKFSDVPKSKWPDLVRAKRSFLAVTINYDCRCLVDFVKEAECVWCELGFDSSEDMIRNGYELDPVEIELAVAWLKHNHPDSEVSLTDIAARVAEAKVDAVIVTQGTRTDLLPDNIRKSSGGTDTDYTLRRLARDAPELLDKIKAGELSVNAAAIAAGIRKKPSPVEQCVKAFRKSENRLEPLRIIVQELEPYELQVLKDWIENGV